MSGHSPSRLRTKTSDLADFFRSSTSHSRQLQIDPQITVPQPMLDVPQTSESPTKLKKTTKIPFLGRTRKKSTHSIKSGAPVASTSSTRGYDSTEIVDSKSTRKDRRLSQPVLSTSPETAPRQPPVPTVVPQTSSSSSLGSKFAAHFAPSKSRKIPSPRVSRAAYSEGETSDTLLPPPSPRAASFESRSSGASGSRSATPRQEKPTITVSLSPDNVDDYKDLFTLPRRKPQSITPASEYRDKYHESASNVTLSPTNGSPRMESLLDSSSSNASRTDADQQASQSLAEDRRSSRSSSVRRSSKGSVTVLGADEPAEESTSSVRNAQALSLGPVIDIRPPSPLMRKNSSPVPRSTKLRTPTSERPSRPPSIPLPPPPNTNPPILPVATVHSVFSTRTPISLSPGQRRPRAHTVSGIPPAPRSSPPIPPDSPSGVPKRTKSPVDKGAIVHVKQSSDKENINIDTASMEELKQALASRTQQYEDLASHLLKVSATHVAEKNALEKKISTMEKDLARKDKEIKGLTWLLVNNRISFGGADLESALNSAQLAYRPSPERAPTRLLRGADESGTESHLTSGAESVSESVLGSGASGTESLSSFPIKKARRPTLGNLYRTSTKSTRGLGVESIASDSSVRSSVYSLSSSAASSSSSLLPPNAGGTGSPLSAIPEGPNQVPTSRFTKTMRERGSLSAGEGEKDERRVTRPHRISTSSLVSSSSSSATSAYSANLKRGRPPSIAQVLEKSSAVEDVLQKLRPFKLSANAPP